HAAGDRADRHEVARGAEHVPEPAPGAVDALEQPHAPRPDVRPDGLRPELADHPLQPLRDLVEGRVPGDPLEVAGALRPDAAEGESEALGGLGVRDVVVELVAEDAPRERVLGIALEPDGAAVA